MKLKLFIPQQIVIDVKDPKNKDEVLEAIHKESKHYSRPTKVAKKLLDAYRKGKVQ